MNPIPHKVKIGVIERLVKEEVMKGKPAMWSREVKNLNHLIKRYPDEGFWSTINVGYKMHSLAFFKTERGADELEIAWLYYKLTGKNKVLDNSTKLETIEGEALFSGTKNLPKQTNT